jgi:hypothetical protein
LTEIGWRIDIVSFEPSGTTDQEVTGTAEQLRSLGIGYHPTRRSASHALGVKVKEAGEGVLRLLARAARGRPVIVHARSYLPAAVARVVSGLCPGSRFLFDLRGMAGEEFIDSGHWAADSLKYRLLKGAEKHLLAQAGGIVVLTDAHRRWLQESKLVPMGRRSR